MHEQVGDLHAVAVEAIFPRIARRAEQRSQIRWGIAEEIGGAPSYWNGFEANAATLSLALAGRSRNDLDIAIEGRQKGHEPIDGIFAEVALEQPGNLG